jgi:hypothetical protein
MGLFNISFNLHLFGASNKSPGAAAQGLRPSGSAAAKALNQAFSQKFSGVLGRIPTQKVLSSKPMSSMARHQATGLFQLSNFKKIAPASSRPVPAGGRGDLPRAPGPLAIVAVGHTGVQDAARDRREQDLATALREPAATGQPGGRSRGIVQAEINQHFEKVRQVLREQPGDLPGDVRQQLLDRRVQLVERTLALELDVRSPIPATVTDAARAVVELGDHLTQLGAVDWPMLALVRTLCNQHAFRDRAAGPDPVLSRAAFGELAAFAQLLQKATSPPGTGAELDYLLMSHGELQPVLLAAKAGAMERFVLEVERGNRLASDIPPGRRDEIRQMAKASVARDLDRQQGLAKLRHVLVDAGRPDLLQTFGQGFRVNASAVAGLRSALGGHAPSVGLVVASLMLSDRLRDSSPDARQLRDLTERALGQARAHLEDESSALKSLFASEAPDVVALKASLAEVATAGSQSANTLVARLQHEPMDVYWTIRGLANTPDTNTDSPQRGLQQHARDALAVLERLLNPYLQARQRVSELDAQAHALEPEIDGLRRQREALQEIDKGRDGGVLKSLQAEVRTLDGRIEALEAFHQITGLQQAVRSTRDALDWASGRPHSAWASPIDRQAELDVLTAQVSAAEAGLAHAVAGLGDAATNVALTGGLSAQEFKRLGMTASEAAEALEVARQLVTRGIASAYKAHNLTATIEFVIDRLGAARFKMLGAGVNGMVQDSVYGSGSGVAEAISLGDTLAERISGKPASTNPEQFRQAMRDAVQARLVQPCAELQGAAANAGQGGEPILEDLAVQHSELQATLADLVSELDGVARRRLDAQDVVKRFNATLPAGDRPKDLEKPQGLKPSIALLALNDLLMRYPAAEGGLASRGTDADKRIFAQHARALRGFDPHSMHVPRLQAGRSIPDETIIRQWLGLDRQAAGQGHGPREGASTAAYDSPANRLLDAARAIVALRQTLPELRAQVDADALEIVLAMDETVRERALLMGSDASETLRDTLRTAVLTVFGEVRDKALKDKRLFALNDFEPASHADRIRQVLEDWGVSQRTFGPEINQILCESFGSDELLLWSATSKVPMVDRVVAATEAERARFAALERDDQQEAGSLRKLLMHGGGKLSSSTKLAMVDAIGRLEPGQKMTWSAGDAVTIRTGSIPIEPSGTAKVEVSANVVHGVNMEVELGGDGYQIMFRNGVDGGGTLGLSAGDSIGEVGPIKGKAIAKANLGLGGGGAWGTMLTFPRGPEGKAQCQKVLEAILLRKALRPVDLLGATRILEVDQRRFQFKASLSAELGADIALYPTTKYKAGGDVTAGFEFKALSRNHHSSDVQIVKKEKDVVLGLSVGLGVTPLSGELGDVDFGRTDDDPSYDAGARLGVQAGIGLHAKFEQKYTFGSDARIVGAEQDRQLSFMPTDSVRHSALRLLGGKAFTDLIDKPENALLAERCRALTAAMGMNDVVKIRFGLRTDVQDEVDRLRLQAAALRHAQAGPDRSQAMDKARHLDEQALKLLDSHENYIPKKLICMTTQEGSLSANLLPLHWVNWAATAGSMGRWVAAEISL